MMADLAARASCPVHYRRLPENLGLTANLLSAVDLARGDYCWLVGSDDILEAGALQRTIDLMAALPGMTGYVVGAVYVDAADPRKRSRQLPRAFHPPGEEPRPIDGLDQIYEQCGNSWILLSWNIVARERWTAAVAGHRERMLAHPVYPQVLVLAMMARARPQWGWLAEPLVRQRNAVTFLFESGDTSLADRWSELIEGIAAVWADVLGGRTNARWRARMRMLARVWGSPEDVRATKLYDDPSPASQLRLARALLGAFWPVRGYWKDVLSASLMPVWLTRLRHGSKRAWLARRAKLRAGQLVLSARLPDRLSVGSVASTVVAVRNLGPRTIPATGPDAMTIAQRWWTSEGIPLEWAKLHTNALAEMPRPILRPIRARKSLSTEVALYAPTEPGTYRLEIVVNQPGRWLDEGGVVRALSVSVDVTATAQAHRP
jgi:hypothetical protein